MNGYILVGQNENNMRHSERTRLSVEWLERRDLLAVNLLPQAELVANSSNPRNLVRAGDYVYFSADGGGINLDQVWRTDGTPEGTISLDAVSSLKVALPTEDGLYFSVSAWLYGPLYRTQGTPETTIQLTDADQKVFGEHLVEFDGEVYFNGRDVNRERQPTLPGSGLMKTSGTPESTDYVLVADRRDTQSRILGVWDGLLHHEFRNRSGLNYRVTDGTPEGTVQPVDYEGGLEGSTVFGELGNTLIGIVPDGLGSELALFSKSSLSPRIVEINPAAPSDPFNFFVRDGNVYFVADDGTHGFELWKSDGTPEGTKFVVDSVVGEQSGTPDWLTWFQESLYFSAGDAIWKYDPTADSANVVRQFEDSPTSFGPTWFTAVNDSLYFVADDGDGEEIWKTDGTADGTMQVIDLHAGVDGSNPAFLTALGDSLIFAALEPEIGKELWILDTEADELQLLADIAPGQLRPPLAFPRDTYVYNDVAYFRYNDGQHGFELWRSDGTQEGTFMLRDINEGRRPSSPRRFFEFNDQLYFLANDGEHGYELWSTDGTAANTQLIKDTWPGRDGVIDLGFEILGDMFYFTANDGEHGVELWESDGTTNGTQRITDIQAGFPGASITHFSSHEGELIFYVNPTDLPGTHELTHGLWRWDVASRTAIEFIDSSLLPSILQDVVSFQDEIVIRDGRGVVHRHDPSRPRSGFEVLVSDRATVPPFEITRLGNTLLSNGRKQLSRINSEFEVEAIGDPANEIFVIGNSYYYTTGYSSTGLSLYRYLPEEDAPQSIPLRSHSDIQTVHPTADHVFVVTLSSLTGLFELWKVDGSDATIISNLETNASEVVPLDNGKILVVTDFDGQETLVAIEPKTEYTTDDIDALFAATQTAQQDLAFDIDFDGRVGTNDINYLFDAVIETDRADLDLNGVVSFADFLLLSTNFGKEEAKWSEGDIDGDGTIAFADFLLLSAAFGQSNE